MLYGGKFDIFPDEVKPLLLRDLKRLGAGKTSSLHFENLGWKRMNLYLLLKRLEKKIEDGTYVDTTQDELPSTPQPNDGLTEEDLILLERFKDKKLGFDEMHRELAIRAFKKILQNPKEVKVRDWLQSELISIKKDEMSKQSDAMKAFVDGLFSGFIPPENCPNCGTQIVFRKEVDVNADSLDLLE